jgi:hypothetical protein
MDPTGDKVELEATKERRQIIRESRLREAEPPSGKTTALENPGKNWRTLLRFHVVLELAVDGGEAAIRCNRCGHLFCHADENYKLYALRQVVNLNDFMPYPLPSGEPFSGEYHEYYCPGCAIQLQVDLYCPALGGDPVLWDTHSSHGEPR